MELRRIQTSVPVREPKAESRMEAFFLYATVPQNAIAMRSRIVAVPGE
jgi:hypothetical protein